MATTDDGFEQQFSAIVAPPLTKAQADLRNAVAAVFWGVTLILFAISPALVIWVWRWAL